MRIRTVPELLAVKIALATSELDHLQTIAAQHARDRGVLVEAARRVVKAPGDWLYNPTTRQFQPAPAGPAEAR